MRANDRREALADKGYDAMEIEDRIEPADEDISQFSIDDLDDPEEEGGSDPPAEKRPCEKYGERTAVPFNFIKSAIEY